MSTALAIAGVTAVLRDRLTDWLVEQDVASLIGSGVTVSVSAPDRVVPEGGTEVGHSLENLEAAIGRMRSESAQGSATEGWIFRVGDADLVDVRTKTEKLCLLAWAAEVSRSLGSGWEAAVPKDGAPPVDCGAGALAARLREIVFDQWGRKRISVLGDDGRTEWLFTDEDLRPGEMYLMHPLNNPIRVDPILVPAGDLA